MRFARSVAFCSCALFALTLPALAAAPTGDAKARRDLAKKIVTQCAGVHEDDVVLLSGDARDLDLLEDMAIEVQNAGADPLQAVSREQASRRYYEEVAAKYDVKRNLASTRLVPVFDVRIAVQGTEFPDLYRNVAPERLAAIEQTGVPVSDALIKRGVRRIFVGNGLYPTAATAKELGVSLAALAKAFSGGLNVDYVQMQKTGADVKARFTGAKEVHLSNANGTDLKLKIEGRPALVSDGVISEADVKQGGAATLVWLPAGEVYVTPVPGTAEGKVVIDRMPWEGGEVNGLTLDVKGGKIVAMSAKASPAYDRFKKYYDAAAAGKDVISTIDVGINPAIAGDGKILSFIPNGMVSVFLGNNTWSGGDNNTGFSAVGFLPTSTLLVDGKPLVEHGALKVAAK